MIEPELIREGDRFIWNWPESAFPCRFTFDGVRETSSDVKAEIKVETAEPVQGGKRGLYHWATLNLNSTSGREGIVKTLVKRTSENGHQRDHEQAWSLMLEYVCYRTAELYREGEPFIDLSTVARPGPVRYCIDKLVPEGQTSIIYGAGEGRKSWIAAALAVTVQASGCIPGLPALIHGPVLYLDWETNDVEIARRTDWVAKGLNLTKAPKIIYRHMTRRLSDESEKIQRMIRQLGIVLVVVDSLGLATGGDINDAAEALRTMNAMNSWTASRLAIAHIPKSVADQSEGRGHVIGSIYYENAARSVWEVRADDNPTAPVSGLFHRKVNVGRKFPEPIFLRIDIDDTRELVTFGAAKSGESLGLSSYTPLSHRIRVELKDGKMSTTQLASELNESEQTIRHTIKRMSDVREIDRGGGRGKPSTWGLTAISDVNAPF